MDLKGIERYTAINHFQQTLWGAALEALFMTHPNKDELAKVFEERINANLALLPQRTTLEKEAVEKVRKGGIHLLSALRAGGGVVNQK